MKGNKSNKSSLIILVLVVIIIIGVVGFGIYQSMDSSNDNSMVTETSEETSNTEITTDFYIDESGTAETIAAESSYIEPSTAETDCTDIATTETQNKGKSRTKLFENILTVSDYHNDEWDIIKFTKKGSVNFTDSSEDRTYYYPYVIDDNVLTIYNNNISDVDDGQYYSYTVSYVYGVAAHGAYYDITLKSEDENAPFNGDWYGSAFE